MKGSMRKRGKRSWELKFDLGTDPQIGRRKIAYRSFKGTKQEAEAALTRYAEDVNGQTYVKPNKLTVGESVGQRIEAWSASGEISPKTAERYGELLRNQIVPHIGPVQLQSLGGLGISEWHGALLKTGLSPLTVRHAHRLFGKALKEAERNGLTKRVATQDQAAPPVPDHEATILERDQVRSTGSWRPCKGTLCSPWPRWRCLRASGAGRCWRCAGAP